MTTSRWLIRILALFVSLTLLATACSDDEDDVATTDDTAEDQEAEEEPEDEPADAASGESAVPEETGPADDSLEPVKIGWINNDDGPVSFPACFSTGYTGSETTMKPLVTTSTSSSLAICCAHCRAESCSSAAEQRTPSTGWPSMPPSFSLM